MLYKKKKKFFHKTILVKCTDTCMHYPQQTFLSLYHRKGTVNQKLKQLNGIQPLFDYLHPCCSYCDISNTQRHLWSFRMDSKTYMRLNLALQLLAHHPAAAVMWVIQYINIMLSVSVLYYLDILDCLYFVRIVLGEFLFHLVPIQPTSPHTQNKPW